MIWDLQTGKVYRSLQAEDNPINAVAFTPDESQLYALDFIINSPQDEKTYIWDIQTGRLVETCPFGTEVFVFSSDGKTGRQNTIVGSWYGAIAIQHSHSRFYQPFMITIARLLSMNGELLAVGTMKHGHAHRYLATE